MSTYSSAKKALEHLSEWARVKPAEPIGLGMERRNGDWVVVVTIADDYHEGRTWPHELDDTSVLVEHHPLPTLRLRRSSRKNLRLG